MTPERHVSRLNTDPDPDAASPVRMAALEYASGAKAYGAVVPTDVTVRYLLGWCDPLNVGVAVAECMGAWGHAGSTGRRAHPRTPDE